MKREAQLLERESQINVTTEFGQDGRFKTSYDFGQTPVYAMSYQLLSRPSQAEQEEEERYMAK